MKSEDDPQEEFLSDVKCIYNAAVPIHFVLIAASRRRGLC